MELPPPQTPATPLRRTKSIATMTSLITPEKIPFDNASTPPSSFDYDLISINKPSSFVAYTSLRDIIMSSSPSNSSLTLPTINGSCSPVVSTVGDISIRNRLVKQAALSYLQPTVLTSSDDSAGSQFFRRIWLHFSAGIQFLRHSNSGEPVPKFPVGIVVKRSCTFCNR